MVKARSLLVSFLGLFFVISCNSSHQDRPADTVLHIPLITDDPGLSWPDAAYQVKVLTPKPSTLLPNTSRLAVAWSPEGLRMWIDAEDAAPVEADDIHSLWKADSIELFLASSPGSQDFIQLVCSPGRTPEHPQPRWEYIDRQKPGHVLTDPTIQVQNRKDGYRLSLFFPWSNLSQTPKEGDTIAVQLYINNIDSGTANSRRLWAPSENNWSPATYNAVQLSKEAGAPRNALAWMELEKLNRLVVKTSCSSEWAGRDVQAGTDASGWKELGRIGYSQEGLVHTVFELPPGLELSPGQQLNLKIGNQRLPAMAVPYIKALRLEVLQKTTMVANPSIFGTSAFPAVDFLARELAETGLGPLKINIRWFNSSYDEVQTATTQGRYGGLVTIETPDGIIDQRKLTVYHTAHPFNTWVDTYENPLGFPAVFGLPPDITQKEKGAVTNFMNFQLYSLGKKDPEWAILAAGLHDLSTSARDLHGIDAKALDADWWYGLEKKLGTATPYPNLVYLPKGYETDKEKTWPLLLFLHGTGERGTDISKVKGVAFPKLLEQGKDFPFITLAPQCPLNEWWNARRLDDLVDQVCKEYRVDPKRIYVTGISMGGFGSWNLAGHYPGKYAAAVPICGGALPDLGQRLKNMPIWVFHGDADSSVPLRSSQVIVDAIRKAGGKPKFTIYPGVGHESWIPAYDDPDLYTWLLQQHL